MEFLQRKRNAAKGTQKHHVLLKMMSRDKVPWSSSPDLIKHFCLDARRHPEYTIIYPLTPGQAGCERGREMDTKRAFGLGIIRYGIARVVLYWRQTDIKATTEVSKNLGLMRGFRRDSGRD
jgi:hypothetical protein